MKPYCFSNSVHLGKPQTPSNFQEVGISRDSRGVIRGKNGIERGLFERGLRFVRAPKTPL